jgi:hypothetical protein
MKYLFVCLTIVIAMSAWVRPAQASFILHKPNAIGLTNGLVGWWTFDGKDMAGAMGITSARTVYDLSGSGNHGKYWNATTTPPTIGKIGQGLELDGADDYIQDPSFSFDPSSSDYTASLWVRYSSTGHQTPLSIRTSALSTGETLVISVNQSGNNGQEAARMNGVQITVTTNSNDGVWHLLTGVRSGTTLSLYVDGVKRGSGTMTATNSGTHSLLVTNGARD